MDNFEWRMKNPKGSGTLQSELLSTEDGRLASLCTLPVLCRFTQKATIPHPSFHRRHEKMASKLSFRGFGLNSWGWPTPESDHFTHTLIQNVLVILKCNELHAFVFNVLWIFYWNKQKRKLDFQPESSPRWLISSFLHACLLLPGFSLLGTGLVTQSLSLLEYQAVLPTRACLLATVTDTWPRLLAGLLRTLEIQLWIQNGRLA